MMQTWQSAVEQKATDWFWFFVDHFFLFAGRRAVESTRPTGFCIIVNVGIKGPARAKNHEQSCLVFCFSRYV